jgi:hypothetical protein
MPGYLLGPFCFCGFGLTALPNQWGERGKQIAPSCPEVTVILHHARKCWSSLTPVGSVIMSMACNLLLWGLMLSLVSMYPRYSISSAKNVDFSAVTFRPASQSCCCAHGNNLYGYGGRVLKIWYLKPTKVHIFKSILGFRLLPWACLNFLSQKSWEGALAKHTANGQTSTRQNCNL